MKGGEIGGVREGRGGKQGECRESGAGKSKTNSTAQNAKIYLVPGASITMGNSPATSFGPLQEEAVH